MNGSHRHQSFHRGRRSAFALLVAGTSIMALSQSAWATKPADSPGKGPGSSHGKPPGNNGTIKIDGAPLEDSNRNEPHVSCVFNVEFYNYEEGDLSATVTFELQAPTRRDEGSQVLLQDTVPIGGDPAGGGGDLDASRRYRLDFAGVAPQPQQGYHVKVTIHADGSKGADVKHKVFWVQPCKPETTTTTVAERPTTTTTTAPPTTTTTRPPTTTTTTPPTTTTSPAVQAVVAAPTTTTTVPTEVLGETLTKPTALPRTGSGDGLLVFLAGLAIALGGAMRLVGMSHRRPARMSI